MSLPRLPLVGIEAPAAFDFGTPWPLSPSIDKRSDADIFIQIWPMYSITKSIDLKYGQLVFSSV